MSLRIKKGDKVIVSSGKSKGKTGKVLKVFSEKNRVIVEGANLVKKHKKRKSESEQGGFEEVPLPVHLSTVQLFCSSCNKGVKTKIKVSKDKSKTRVCKKCQKAI
ncbi:MAG: 50S ribosomal protein L24 [Candidatus Omnitrophica bacterium]|nr:50S ribosomal protein L24 [Candidatus Omnitrophota bacterium]